MQCDRLFEMVEGALPMYLEEIQEWIAVSSELSLSRQSIDRLLRHAGYCYTKAAAERDEGVCATFRHMVQQNLTAGVVVTVDESSRDGRIIFRQWGITILAMV